MARRGFMDDSDRLTARQYAAIGRVAALWAETEWAMERILTRLALVPSLLGFILTDKLGPDNRINAIYSLIDVHRLKYAGFVDAAVLTEIEECLSSIGEMKGDRNFIVHSVWAKSDDASISRTDITGAARSGAHITVGPSQSLKSIEDFAEQVDEAAKVLWELGSKIPVAQPTSLKKLNELERESRRHHGGGIVRRVQPKAFARLVRKPRQPKSRKKAKRA